MANEICKNKKNSVCLNSNKSQRLHRYFLSLSICLVTMNWPEINVALIKSLNNITKMCPEVTGLHHENRVTFLFCDLEKEFIIVL